jgi:hypothetical protein
MLRPLAATLFVLAAPAHADELQTRLVAGARATDTSGYAFRQTIVMAGTGVGDKGGPRVIGYDPRRAAGDRWRLVSVDGRAPTAKELEGARKRMPDTVPGYADMAKWLGSPATRVDGPGGSVTYRYARLPTGTVKLGKHDASADTAAEVQVSGASGPAPFVERVRFTSTRGFRMMLVASVKSMALVTRFRRLPDGAVVPVAVDSRFAGSLMGKSGEIRTDIAYADWQKVR